MKSWEPKPYQYEAVKFMVSKGVAGLFLDPGLGKTSTTLAAFKVLRQRGFVHRMLVIAPLRVAHNVWPNEVMKWTQFADLTVRVLHGSDRSSQARRSADVYVVNPEALVSPQQWLQKELPYMGIDMLVVDESTRFKNTTTARFKALRPLLETFSRRYILTGTPAPQGVEDLFGQVYILDRGAALGQYITHFRREHFEPHTVGPYTEWTLRPGHDKIVIDKIAPFCMRMDAADYLQLPELVENTVEVELPDDVRAAYQRLEKDFVVNLVEGDVVALSSTTLGMKLRQICNGGVYGEDGKAIHAHDAKCDALASIVEEAGSPVLCAYQFRHDVDRIRAYFKHDIPFIGGGVSEKVSAKHIADFNAGRIKLLLAHPASAGHGLNLQDRANHVVFFGLPWSLEEFDQFIRRVYRQGNPNTHVFLHTIVARNTVEAGMVKALGAKDRSQRAFFDAVKAYYRVNP